MGNNLGTTGFQGKYTIAWALFILVMSVLPTPDQGDVGSFPHIDKLAHIFLYAVLVFVAAGDLKRSQYVQKSQSMAFIMIFFCILIYGIFIEMVQFLLPYRSFELMDIYANSIGSFGGLLIFFVFYHNRIAKNK